ncbi:MAG TPA: P1 family peptidase [Roseiflexaceae bacterium]|nr:P1 family peptidase [Roseiflexaceae bacterium]
MSISLSNDNVELTPQTVFDGPALVFDFDRLEIGVAEYDEGPTGCTVFLFPDGAATSIDVRGGSPGLIGNYEWNHAICLAGGSLYGLEATAGVTAELFARRDYSTHWDNFALASGAIIYDYGRRDNSIYPDKALGRAAARAARAGVFPLGARGAGRSARCGGWFDRSEPCGQGGAFRQIGPAKIAVFCVVNALGVIVDRQGSVVRGNLDRATGRREHYREELDRRIAGGLQAPPSHGNTTLSVVITNQKLDASALRQLSRQVHGAISRAIQPFHTVFDGDVLYAVTTNQVENSPLDAMLLGMLGSELAWDAVLSSFQE